MSKDNACEKLHFVGDLTRNVVYAVLTNGTDVMYTTLDADDMRGMAAALLDSAELFDNTDEAAEARDKLRAERKAAKAAQNEAQNLALDEMIGEYIDNLSKGKLH
jgi:hypothetical protein